MILTARFLSRVTALARSLAGIAVGGCTGYCFAAGDSLEYVPPTIHQRPARIEFTSERLDLPGAETMGFAGLGFLVDLTPSLYAGVRGFGAVSGNRGGFFTAGFEAGAQTWLGDRWRADAGLFVGGGGGGAAPQGGGLMLRPHLGLTYDLRDVRVGVQYSLVKFPNGDIDSSQLGLVIEVPTVLRHAAGKDTGRTVSLERVAEGTALHGYGFTFHHYQPIGSARDTAGIPLRKGFGLVGAKFRRQSGYGMDWTFDLAGAMSGGADGYAEAFVGVARGLALGNGRWILDGSASIGGGGGGGIDTGGGAMGRLGMGLRHRLSRDVELALDLGYARALDGTFGATRVGASLVYLVESATFGGDRPVERTDRLVLSGWRWRVANQTFLSPARKTGGPSQDIQLLGLKADLLTSESSYLTGQALGAYAGGAGGYAVGLAGLGWRWPVFGPRNRFTAEILVGASGGGGISVGGGAMVHGMFGLEREIGDNSSLALSVGRVASFSGGLSATTVDLSFGYRFSTPGRRIRAGGT